MVHAMAQIFGRACTMGRSSCPRAEAKAAVKASVETEACGKMVIYLLTFFKK